MLKRFLVISSFFLILLAYSGNEAYGQLITDSNKRLKTQKTKNKGGFSLFKKKKGKSSSSGALRQSKQGGSPRYSSGSPFAAFNKRKSQSPNSASSDRKKLFKNQRYTAPRYSSSGLAKVMSGKKKPVRYSASGSPFSKRDKVVSPRYSSSKPFEKSIFAKLFNSRSASPRYSGSSPFTKRDKKVFPKYSAGSPFTKKQKSVTPRYSAKSPYEKNFFQQIFSGNSGPRYSAAMPFTKKDKTVFPRYSGGSPYQKSFLERLFNPTPPVKYSAGSPFTKKQQTIYPRYSAGSPYTKKQMAVTPRYSTGSPFQKGFFERLFNPGGVSPRYSPDKPFSRRDRLVSPRYSVAGPEDKSFFEKLFSRSFQPRYSQGSPYAQINWNLKPRYSTYKDRFKGNKRVQEQMRPYNEGTAQYQGDIKGKTKVGVTLDNLRTTGKQSKYEGHKVPRYNPSSNKDASTFSGNFKRKWVDENKMHPSFRHNKVNNPNKTVRNGFRKWSVFWTRLNRNKVQPDAVTDKVSKPKFDRKETEIWNN